MKKIFKQKKNIIRGLPVSQSVRIRVCVSYISYLYKPNKKKLYYWDVECLTNGSTEWDSGLTKTVWIFD